MKWTRKRPILPGYYWVFETESDKKPRLVQVILGECHYDHGLEVLRLGSEVHDSIYLDYSKLPILWFGPISLKPPGGWNSLPEIQDEVKSKMEWAGEKPTQPGWYYYKGDLYALGEKQERAHCDRGCKVAVHSGDDRFIIIYQDQGLYDYERADGLWSSLEEPFEIPAIGELLQDD